MRRSAAEARAHDAVSLCFCNLTRVDDKQNTTAAKRNDSQSQGECAQATHRRVGGSGDELGGLLSSAHIATRTQLDEAEQLRALAATGDKADGGAGGGDDDDDGVNLAAIPFLFNRTAESGSDAAPDSARGSHASIAGRRGDDDESDDGAALRVRLQSVERERDELASKLERTEERLAQTQDRLVMTIVRALDSTDVGVRWRLCIGGDYGRVERARRKRQQRRRRAAARSQRRRADRRAADKRSRRAASSVGAVFGFSTIAHIQTQLRSRCRSVGS